MRVFLADLGHDQVTVSSDVFPLGVANLATFVQADGRVAEPVQTEIFRAPSAFKEAVDAGMPDLVGFSNYSWNHRLTRHFARYVKERNEGVLVAMGGPNFPLTRGEQEEFVRSMPEIDVHVRGPTYEGERAFLNLVRRYADVACSREGVFGEAIPGNVWVDRKTGEFVVGGDVPKLESLDEIPSPYRRGIMDQFFGSGLFPLLQITRGCPFTCAFCNSAVRSNTVRRHSVEEVQADLRYVAERVDPEVPLCFADDNFGMYPWDEEISDFIAKLQEERGWPRYIRTTTGKNRGDRIVKVMRKLRGVLPMTSAVQSLNPTVLENIERDNIDLDTYAQIQDEVQAQGMQAYGELILCLPGETKESFMKAIRDLLASGVKRVAAHQLMLLHGAPLSNPDVRAQHGFVTRHRVVARNLGAYTGEPVIETEEVVVATPDISFDEYLEIRVFHLLLTIFHYEGNFEEMFALARGHGVEAFDLVVALQEEMDRAPRAFRAVIDRFLEESELELFESEAECVAWAKENFEELRAGRVGGNLLQNYSMEGRFFVTLEALEFLETALRTVLGADVDSELRSVSKYLRGVLLHAPFDESLEDAPRWETNFDVEAWRGDGFERSLAAYRLEEPVQYRARLPGDRKAVLEQRLETFGESPTGLGKFTRTMFATDLRREVAVEASEPIGAGTSRESSR